MGPFKSFRLLLAGIGAVFFVHQANAADFLPAPGSGWYLRGDLGWSWLNWNGGADDGALTGGAGIGKIFDYGLRADARAETSEKFDSGTSFTISTLMGNVYYDFAANNAASPYVGLGAGAGWASANKPGDDFGLAWQASAGLNLRISDSITGDVGYRFRDVMLTGDNLTDHSLLVGLRYSF